MSITRRLLRRLRRERIYYKPVARPRCMEIAFSKALALHNPQCPDSTHIVRLDAAEVSDGYLPGFYRVNVRLQYAAWMVR